MSFEWNLIRLHDLAHGIVTKTVHKTLSGSGGIKGVGGGGSQGVGGFRVGGGGGQGDGEWWRSRGRVW